MSQTLTVDEAMALICVYKGWVAYRQQPCYPPKAMGFMPVEELRALLEEFPPILPGEATIRRGYGVACWGPDCLYFFATSDTVQN